MPEKVQRCPHVGRRVLTAGLAATVLAGGCTGASDRAEVSPLRDGRATGDTPTPPENSDPRVASDRSATDTPASENADPTNMNGTEEELNDLNDLLVRFDAAISALYAEPLAAGDDNHPLSLQWLEVVVGGSQLDRQVRGRIRAAGADDGMRIVPDASGTSFTNVALEVTEDPDGSLRWTNCGYAPGVGIDLDTGEVLDDNRTSTRGRGRAVRSADGTLSISELWDDESHLLAPGVPDPCIELARKATGDTK